jgi:hypothetical protein
MKTIIQLALIAFLTIVLGSCESKKIEMADSTTTVGADGLDRTVLPIKAPPIPTSTELDVRNTTIPSQCYSCSS